MKIVEMLNAGKSYSDIQMELGVSPSKISQVKKEFAQFINPNSSSGSSSATTTHGEHKNSGLNDFRTDNPTIPNGSSSDPETLLRMKELELEHQRLLKQMEYDEKERERDYEREKKEKELEEMRLRAENSSENKNLREYVQKLESEVEELREYMQHDEEEEDETDFDDSIFYDPYYVLLQKVIDGDELKWDDDEIIEMLESIESLKQSFIEYCEYDGTDVHDFDEWEILLFIEEKFGDLKQEIADSIFSSRARLSLSDEWLDKLREKVKSED